ncbi:hypothetical protein FB45DRAFT_26752 [Roridomyces roridus]|uniref:Uncharacterized protein n=1 Tax=Roridomyces roridus TaxID=1738132 RepID=A0AAD7CKC4_9AGAR|nr:hypothetical protein FB45DRAFT_26752 [Roridomyces roridus]
MTGPLPSPYTCFSALPPSSLPYGVELSPQLDSWPVSSNPYMDGLYGFNTASAMAMSGSATSPFPSSEYVAPDSAVFTSAVNATFFPNNGITFSSHHLDPFPSAGGLGPSTITSQFSSPSPLGQTPESTHFALSLLYPDATGFHEDWQPVQPNFGVPSDGNNDYYPSLLLMSSSSSPSPQTFTLQSPPRDDAGLGDLIELNNLQDLPRSTARAPPSLAYLLPAREWPSNHPGRASTEQYLRTKLANVPPNLWALEEDSSGNLAIPVVLVLKVLLYEYTMLQIVDVYEVLPHVCRGWCEKRNVVRWKTTIRNLLYTYHAFVRIPFTKRNGKKDYCWFFDYTKEGFKGQARPCRRRPHCIVRMLDKHVKLPEDFEAY